jgi:hypothetical protein
MFSAILTMRRRRDEAVQLMKSLGEAYKQLKSVDPDNHLLSMIELKALETPEDFSIELNKEIDIYFPEENAKDDPFGLLRDETSEMSKYLNDLKTEYKSIQSN